MTPESQNIEWKQLWQDDCLKWICGFANAQGGRIFIGKDDTGQITGIKNPKKLLEDLPNKIRDQLGLMPNINLLHEDNKAYLEIIVEASTVPISLRGSYYWRSGSVKQELKGHALTDFLLKKMGITWDRLIEEKATLDDIDDGTIELFKKEAATAGRLPDITPLSNEELLKKLRLLTKRGLTNAALILFGKDPAEFYPNLFVKIGRFGQSVVDMRFQEVCEGNLFQMLHDVMEQLEKKFLIKPVRFEGLRRIEELEYPVPALREMLLNALVHRNYMGSMTQLKVMNDRISLWNAGTLPVELTVDKLFQLHGSIPRNPLIAEVCYKAGYIDSWGRGVERITEECERAGLFPPLIKECSGGVAIELIKHAEEQQAMKESSPKSPSESAKPSDKLDNGLGDTKERSEDSSEIISESMSGKRWESIAKASGKHPESVGKASDKRRESIGKASGKHPESVGKASGKRRVSTLKASDMILKACRENPSIIIPELAKQIGITERSIQRNIQKLQADGFLRRVGGRKEGHWDVLESDVLNQSDNAPL